MPATYSGQKWSVEPKTANYTLVDTDFLILADTSGGGFALTLPITPDEGQAFMVKKTSEVGILVINGNGESVDGAPTAELTSKNDAIHLVFETVGGWVIV